MTYKNTVCVQVIIIQFMQKRKKTAMIIVKFRNVSSEY